MTPLFTSTCKHFGVDLKAIAKKAANRGDADSKTAKELLDAVAPEAK